MANQKIELYCEPGAASTPDTYLAGVLEGTGIEPVKASNMLSGDWTFEFDHVPEATWKAAQPVLKERITKLYALGYIRYGSW